jgi:EAL domain-containing protein (putative c-di-GMP-specific phosphodiesterase class I)
MTSELGWANRLQQALDNDRFRLCFQPILALEDIDFDQLPENSSNLWATHHRYRNSPPTYIESLIRFREEDGTEVPPNLFLPSAERFGLMPKIDLWVVRNALQVLQDAHDLGLYFTLGINLSAITLEDEQAISQIYDYIKQMPVPSRHLAIEITERSAITNMVGVKSFVETINEMGCQFALDDFGAGFSSFAQLRHLPVRYVKIDGEYINNMNSDDTDRVIVNSINDIAHSIGRSTIAEYVANAEILKSLRDCSIDYAQGFYIAEPMSKEDLFVIYEDEPTVLAAAYDVEALK